jgi:predicted alpha/beta hydrolase family esterase
MVAENLILLIHGLGGDQDSWENTQTVLGRDADLGPVFDVDTFRYKSSIIPFVGTKSIEDVAGDLEIAISREYAKYSRIILVGHSLGAIIARRCAINICKKGGRIRVKGILMVASPNQGSELDTYLRKNRYIDANNRQLIQLAVSNNTLGKINEEWQLVKAYPSIHCACVYAGMDDYVHSASAKDPCSEATTKEIKDCTHTSIIKVTSDDHPFFKILKEYLLHVVNSAYTEILLWRASAKDKVHDLFYTAAHTSCEVFTTQFFPFRTNPLAREDYLDTILKHELRNTPDINVTFSRYVNIENHRFLNDYIKRYFSDSPPNLKLKLYLPRSNQLSIGLSESKLFNKMNLLLIDNSCAYVGLDRVAVSEEDKKTLGVYVHDKSSLERLKNLWSRLVENPAMLDCIEYLAAFKGVSLYDFVRSFIEECVSVPEMQGQLKYIALFGGYAANWASFTQTIVQTKVTEGDTRDVDLLFVVDQKADLTALKAGIIKVTSGYAPGIDVVWGDDPILYPPRNPIKISFDIELYPEGDRGFVDEAPSSRTLVPGRSRRLLGSSILYRLKPLYNPDGQAISTMIGKPETPSDENARGELFKEADKGVRYFIERFTKIGDGETDGRRVLSQIVKNYYWYKLGVRPTDHSEAKRFIEASDPLIAKLVEAAEKNPKVHLLELLERFLA